MRIPLRRMPRLVKASFLAVITASLLTVGIASPASANYIPPPSQEISWTNGLYSHTYHLMLGGDYGQPWMSQNWGDNRSVWYDVQNSDGTWNELDNWGNCLTAYGSTVKEVPCNGAKNGTTDTRMRWREISMGSGNGWKLQNVSNGYYLDWTGTSPNTGTVYAHNGDANNPNERWY